MISVLTALVVIFLGVLVGILAAIVVSILLFFRRNWWPHGEVLGDTPDIDGWHTIGRHPEAEQVEGVVVYRWEAPIFFANSGVFADQIRHLIATNPSTRWIVLQCDAITDIDVTAADVLERLDREFNRKGVHLAFVNLRGRLKDRLLDYGLMGTLDQGHFFYSMDEAMDAIRREA